MRFRCFVAIIFLLIVEKSEGATEASCTTKNWFWDDQMKNLETCRLAIDEVDDEYFTISSESNPTTLDFMIRDKKGVKFLPTNLFSIYPALVALRVYNCSVTAVNGNNFKSMSKLKFLNLPLNKIENVASDAFADLVSLEHLGLSDNRIKLLDENTFGSLTALKELFLESNEIQSLHPNIFDSLVNVEFIRLDGNKISSLDEKIFKNLSSLQKIFLGENKLEKIHKNLFKNNLKLESIWFNDNRIKFIDPETFDHLSNLDYVGLMNNLCSNTLYRPEWFDLMKNDLKQNCAE